MNPKLKYSLVVFVSIVVSFFMYYITPDSNESKNDITNIITRNVIPGISFGLFVFLLIKYKDPVINNEQLMFGNYFDE